MIISDFTNPELTYFRQHCNFTCEELNVFELRSIGVSLEQIAVRLNLTIDKVKKISRKVNNKIIKVL